MTCEISDHLIFIQMLNEEFLAYNGQKNFKMEVIVDTPDTFDLTITAKWFFQGDEVKKDDANFTITETQPNGQFLFRLKIKNVSKKIAGNYSVKIEANDGKCLCD